MTKSLAQVMREALEKYGRIGTRELANKPEFAGWTRNKIRETRNNVLNEAAKSEWVKNNPERRMCAKIKSRCKRSNTYFDIKPEDLVIPKTCPVLGIALDSSTADHVPSVDRFDPSKGYTTDNINIISNRANSLKNNATFTEIEKLYNWMKKQEDLRS